MKKVGLPEEFDFIYVDDESIVFKGKIEDKENVRVKRNKPEGIKGTLYKKDDVEEFIKKGDWVLI